MHLLSLFLGKTIDSCFSLLLFYFHDSFDWLLFSVLGIPTVAELLNLFVEIIPDVIIGPSHYSVEHPSVLRAKVNTILLLFGIFGIFF